MAKLRGYEPSLENKYSSGREDCRWSAFQLSVIMVMPVTNLRELASERTYPFQFDEVKRWLKICTSSGFQAKLACSPCRGDIFTS